MDQTDWRFGTGKVYTDDEKRRAIDRYFEYGSSTKAVEDLGYPSVVTLMGWVKKDPRYSAPAVRKYHHYEEVPSLRL